MVKNLLAFSLFVLLQLSVSSYGQVVVTFPSDRAIFQRNNANTATVYIAGYLTESYQSIEVRLDNRNDISDDNTANWVTIDNSIQAGHFYGSMTITGGWYRMEVRGSKTGSKSAITTVEHVGVGEVFVIAGQSNATGGDGNENGAGAVRDEVNSVNFQNYSPGEGIATYNNIQLPCPTFVHLDAETKTAPFGNYAWCWGSFGDKMYEKYQVPIMIFNAGWSSTGIDNWQQTINPTGTTVSAFGAQFPEGLPFGHLRLALNYYAAQLGVRAVLWHQGETDNLLENANTFTNYSTKLQEVISASRSLTNKANLAWVVARASRFNVNNVSRVSSSVLQAQNAVIAADAHVYEGPATDDYYDLSYRSDQVHFRGDGIKPSPDGNIYSGLVKLAEFWVEKLDLNFLDQSVPYPATPPLPVTTAYVENNTRMSLTGPAKASVQDEYNWIGSDCKPTSNTEQQLTVSPGSYRLRMIDQYRNTVFSPMLNFSGSALPVSWKYFNARTGANGRARLEWATATETNSAHFEVERSLDAISFNHIKTIESAGNSSTENTYSYEDEYLPAGQYYYRLRQVDKDEKYDYTRIAGIKITGTETLKVYPNPVTDLLTLESMEPLKTVEMFNVSGQRVYLETTGHKKLNLKMAGFPRGLYTVKVNGKSFRIVK